MSYSRIIGTGAALPDKVVSNEDIAALVDTSDEWIMKRVGISKRHVVEEGEMPINLATKAAKQAIQSAGISPADIELIIVGTSTPDNVMPSTACLLQEQLGVEECPAFDLNAACSGFIYAMTVADKFVKTGEAQYALVVGMDALTRVVDWQDRSTCVLFGDGAGAAVLKSDDRPGIIATTLHANGKYKDMLYAASPLWSDIGRGSLKMAGGEVFKIAVTKLGNVVDEILQKAGLEKKDIDWLIPHQANTRIIEATAKRLNLSMDKVILTIKDHGNTSAASIPLALRHAMEQHQIKPGQRVLFEAFGAGFTWGAMIVEF